MRLHFAVPLELLRQLTIRHLGKESLFLSSSLWTVLEPLITLVAVVGCHPKPLNTSNITVALIQRRHTLTREKMVYANSHLKMLVSKSLTLSTLPW